MMLRILIIASLGFILANCASVSTLQTGRVLKKGDSFHSVGVASYTSDDFLGGDDLSIPLIEYTYRRGMWQDIDVGIKFAIIGSTVIDAKYNLVDGDKFALATGLGLGYLSFESDIGTQKTESTIIDLILPLYLSYDVGEKVTLYSAAKYFLRSISTDQSTDVGDGSMASGTLGVQWGRESGVFLEGTLITGLDNDFSGTQFNSSYFFRF